MRKTQRLAAVGAMAALTVVLGACGSTATPSAPASAPAAAPTSAAAPAASGGVTTAADVFGGACSMLPQGDAPGGLTAMGPQPVATAAGTNPLLTTLVKAVGAVPGLADTLNSQKAITVYAPFDGAFKEIPAADLTALLGKPTELGALLSYHVVPMRLDAKGLLAAGKTTQLAGGDVTVSGTATDGGMTLTSSGGTKATVLCGNIPTSNATVFVIDKVLMPKA